MYMQPPIVRDGRSGMMFWWAIGEPMGSRRLGRETQFRPAPSRAAAVGSVKTVIRRCGASAATSTDRNRPVCVRIGP
jgi:hypothetical protein